MHRAPPSICALVRKVLNAFQLSTGFCGIVHVGDVVRVVA